MDDHPTVPYMKAVDLSVVCAALIACGTATGGYEAPVDAAVDAPSITLPAPREPLPFMGEEEPGWGSAAPSKDGGSIVVDAGKDAGHDAKKPKTGGKNVRCDE